MKHVIIVYNPKFINANEIFIIGDRLVADRKDNSKFEKEVIVLYVAQVNDNVDPMYILEVE